MKQIKIFNYSNTRELQDRVNRWIVENGKVIISQILQSEAPGTAGEDGEGWGVTITVVYDTDTPASSSSD
jgi:hypothetical protein